MRFRRSPHTSSTSAPAAATRSCSAAPWTSETTLIRMAAPSGGSDAGRPDVLCPCYGWSGTVRPRTAGIMDGSTNGGWRAVAGSAGGGDLRVRLPGVARALLPAGADGGRVARVLRAGLRGGGARRDLLPAARTLGGGRMGGVAPREVRPVRQGAAGDHPRGAAGGRRRHGHAGGVRAGAGAAGRPPAGGGAPAPAEPWRRRGPRAAGQAARHQARWPAGGGRVPAPVVGPPVAGRPAGRRRRRPGARRPARGAAVAGVAGPGPLPA